MNNLLNAWPEWLTSFWEQWHVLIRVVLILLGAVLVRWLLLFMVRRVVKGVIASSRTRSKQLEFAGVEIASPLAQERLVQRTQTMGSVLRNFITWSVLILASTMLLSELGVQIGALAAGVGLLGAGIGFGAQTLVKDLLSGMFLVFEDQFGVGDSVNLGEVSGVVEAVGLRVTQVRDANGLLWYVRNGEINRVGNESQGWSQAIVDIAVPANSDWQKAKALLEKVAPNATASGELSKKVLAEPDVWGIHALTGDQVVLRITQKVKPTCQDEVARAIRATIKPELDKAGIALATERAVLLEAKRK